MCAFICPVCSNWTVGGWVRRNLNNVRIVKSAQNNGRSLIHNFLQLRDINIVRVTRKGLTDERLGIVKIELPSKQAVDEVLKSKHKPNQYDDPSISGIFIRKSLPDEVRQQQRIKYLDPGPQGLLTKTKRGDIVPTNHSRGGYGGHGHGRGRGGRGRGGHGSPLNAAGVTHVEAGEASDLKELLTTVHGHQMLTIPNQTHKATKFLQVMLRLQIQ